MARQQQEVQERERIEQELRVARMIQQTLLPKSLPDLEGYQIAAYYQSAREVGGDFYDFLRLPDGRLGLIVGDVSGKGVPAAIMMATTRTLLRAAYHLGSPGEILEQVNDALFPDIPPNMFVTCLAALLDSRTGRLQYANAGHDPPYIRHAAGVSKLRATGMPLGLMPNMSYEQKEITLQPGENILLYSDGLLEAHSPQREMFGFPRMQGHVSAHPEGASLIDSLLAELERFTGEDWEQEDDITLLTLQRLGS
jgi:serine phosphatase RsbU (regulator of sigma subunit)